MIEGDCPTTCPRCGKPVTIEAAHKKTQIECTSPECNLKITTSNVPKRVWNMIVNEGGSKQYVELDFKIPAPQSESDFKLTCNQLQKDISERLSIEKKVTLSTYHDSLPGYFYEEFLEPDDVKKWNPDAELVCMLYFNTADLRAVLNYIMDHPEIKRTVKFRTLNWNGKMEIDYKGAM